MDPNSLIADINTSNKKKSKIKKIKRKYEVSAEAGKFDIDLFEYLGEEPSINSDQLKFLPIKILEKLSNIVVVPNNSNISIQTIKLNKPCSWGKKSFFVF